MSVREDLIAMIREESGKGFYADVMLEAAADSLERSRLFTIHADLADEHIEFGRDLYKQGLLQMPFFDTLIEFIQPDGHRAVCLVRYGQGEPAGGHVFAFDENARRWTLFAWVFAPPLSIIMSDPTFALAGRSPDGFVAFPPLNRQDLSDEETSLVQDWAGYWSLVFMATPSILMSKSARRETVTASPKLNAARVRQGKAPIEDRTVIRIGEASAGRNGLVDGDRRPPRMHWRRGHIRRISGDRLIPVAPTIVGADGAAFIKRYLFKN